MSEERAAHRSRRTGDEELDALAVRLSGDAVHRVRSGRIEKRYGREIDHERLLSVCDAIEHRAHGRRGAKEESAGDAIHQYIGVGRETRIVGYTVVAEISPIADHKRKAVPNASHLRYAVDEQHRAEPKADHD